MVETLTLSKTRLSPLMLGLLLRLLWGLCYHTTSSNPLCTARLGQKRGSDHSPVASYIRHQSTAHARLLLPLAPIVEWNLAFESQYPLYAPMLAPPDPPLASLPASLLPFLAIPTLPLHLYTYSHKQTVL